MTDRAQPGARGSSVRNIELGEGIGQASPGWIVPASTPTLSSQRYTSLDTSQYAEFDATFGAGSLDVTIAAGEAFVDGWIARDTDTTITLDASTAGQQIWLGWDASALYDSGTHATRDDADQVICRLEQNFPANEPYVPIWEFDTDGSGVTNDTDLRYVGPIQTAGNEVVQSVPDLPSADDFPLGTEFFVLDVNQSYEVVQQ